MLSKRGLTDVAILEDKIRLIRGQATDISGVQIRGLIAVLTASVPAARTLSDNDPIDITTDCD
jgi:hypothetical protein